MFWYRLFRKSDDGLTVTPKTGVYLLPSTVAASQTRPGIPVKYVIQVATSASNGNTDVVVTNKFRILDVYVIQQAAAVTSEVCTLYNGTNAVSSTMSLAAADKSVARATTIDDAYWDVAAGGTLRVTTSAGASQPQCVVVVEGVLIA